MVRCTANCKSAGVFLALHRHQPCTYRLQALHEIDTAAVFLDDVFAIEPRPESLQDCDVQLGVVLDLIDERPLFVLIGLSRQNS